MKTWNVVLMLSLILGSSAALADSHILDCRWQSTSQIAVFPGPELGNPRIESSSLTVDQNEAGALTYKIKKATGESQGTQPVLRFDEMPVENALPGAVKTIADELGIVPKSGTKALRYLFERDRVFGGYNYLLRILTSSGETNLMIVNTVDVTIGYLCE